MKQHFETIFNFIKENAILILVVLVLISGGMGAKMIDDFFYYRQINKEYKDLQKELDQKKKEYEKEIRVRSDTILTLQKENIKLKESIEEIHEELKAVENEKVKVIYRVANMSISEQQEYFTDRYKEGSSPRLNNSSSGNSGLGTGGLVLQASRVEESGNRYFERRYQQFRGNQSPT